LQVISGIQIETLDIRERYEKVCHRQTQSLRHQLLKHLSKVRRHDLDNSRSGNSVVVRDGGSVGLEDGVNLTSGACVANGDSGVDHVVLDNSGREHGTVGEREGDVERAGGDSASRGEVEGDRLALHDRTVWLLLTLRAGNALTGRVGLEAGQDLMKGDARE